MTDLPRPTEIDQTVALAWLRYSLGQSEVEVISPVALKFIEDRKGHAYTLAPERVDPARLATPRWGGVIGSRSAREGFSTALEGLTERGAACVVIEDEANWRRYPKPSLDGLLLVIILVRLLTHTYQ